LTAGDRLTAKVLAWLPWLVFLVSALPPAAYFLFRYFTATENVGEYMLFALTSLGVGAVLGLVAGLLVLVFRGPWRKRLRERLAADGVTADELEWFMSELAPGRRRALKQMEAQNPLLADAYRETLAASLTAERLLRNAGRDELDVEGRLHQVARLQSSGRAALEEDLRGDLARVQRIKRETAEYRDEIETRLQAIEAIANRRASESETEVALQRLGAARAQAPLQLESARAESDAREEVELELREKLAQHRRDLSAIENSLRQSPSPPDKS
jgi:hypothetical protein